MVKGIGPRHVRGNERVSDEKVDGINGGDLDVVRLLTKRAKWHGNRGRLADRQRSIVGFVGSRQRRELKRKRQRVCKKWIANRSGGTKRVGIWSRHGRFSPKWSQHELIGWVVVGFGDRRGFGQRSRNTTAIIFPRAESESHHARSQTANAVRRSERRTVRAGKIKCRRPQNIMISTKTHGALDYLVGILMVYVPWLFGFAGSGWETHIFVTLGIAALIYSVCTKYELGLFPLIPMKGHLALDLASGVILAASPFLFGFAERVMWPHVLFGFLEIGVALATKRAPREAIA